MNIYNLQKTTYMPISIEQAWDFFSLATNLEKITPKELDFRIIAKPDVPRIFSGMRIQYKVRPLLNIAVKWETEIREVDAPFKFMDKQLKGPYALWEHTHLFEEVPGGVKMIDTVSYALPLGWLGVFMHSIVVKKKLDEIFTYREQVVKDLFGEYKPL